MDTSKIQMHTADLAQENFQKLAALFPDCVVEASKDGKVGMSIDMDKLAQEIGNTVVEGNDERYQFTWPGKRQAIVEANASINHTLRPDHDKSKYFDTTQNLFIEGNNLPVLKMLREPYLHQVKVVYLDPPYNTGKDFVYSDKFAQSTDDYLHSSGQVDEEGQQLVANGESEGRFHTNWLNMMYPRLRIIKDLLAEDGVVFISIDYHEVTNLRKICDEIFGESNYVGEIIWETATDNNPTQIAMQHEYIECYAKNLKAQPKWAIMSEKAEIINKKYRELKAQNDDPQVIQKELRAWINSMKKSNEVDLSGVSHYNYVDEKGVFYPGNSANTRPGGYTYDIIHPVTGKVCAKPENGYRWPEATFWDADKRGDVLWGADETTIPKIKKRIETATEMLKSYYYEDNRKTTNDLKELFDGHKVFDNPKSLKLMEKLFNFTTTKDSLVMDIFAGSATTAHAIMELNAQDGGHRRYILVQVPAAIEENQEAFKMGYKNICELGEDRIRRAGEKLLKDYKLTKETLDVGFRVLTDAESNMVDEFYNPKEYNGNLFQTEFEKLANNIKQGRTGEDLLFQTLLEMDIPLSSSVKTEEIDGKKVFNVGDGILYACFEPGISNDMVTNIAKRHPLYFVTAQDSLESDSVIANLDTIFRTYSKDTTRKIL